MTDVLPDFRLETYFARWEFTARHHLTASDAESMTVAELLAYEPGAADGLAGLSLGYIPTRGTDGLRSAIADTYDRVGLDDVLCFAGAEEALYWAMRLLVGPGDHAIVTLPNYQSMETVPVATGATVTGLPLWTGAGPELRWTLDLDRLRAAIRPETRLIAVNFPNNPTGFLPDERTFRELAALCDERGIWLFSDEVYRGLEAGDPLPQAADLTPRGISLGVVSKSLGLPGLRIGWIACRDADLIDRLDRHKQYTSICDAAPSEFLAAVAIRHRTGILARNRAIIESNLREFGAFFADFAGLFDWAPPLGGCVAFPRYTGTDGVEEFCRRAVEEHGVLLLPASLYRSELGDVPTDRFRLGVGRRDPGPGIAALRGMLA